MDNWTHSLMCPTVLKEVVQLVILVQLLLTIRPLLKLLFLLVLLNAGWQLRMLFGTFLPVHMLNLQRSLLRSLENTDIYTCTGRFIQWHGQGHIQIQCLGTYIHWQVHEYIYRNICTCTWYICTCKEHIYLYTFTGTYLHVQVHLYMFRYIFTCTGTYINMYRYIYIHMYRYKYAQTGLAGTSVLLYQQRL